MKNSPFTAFLLSALSPNDMQFIPGVFYKPFSLIRRCKSPSGSGRAQHITAFRTARQADRHADRRTENNAADCIRMEWEAGRYLGKKVGAEKEEDISENVWSSSADRETGRQEYGQRGRRIGSLTGDRSAGWGHLLPPIIRSSAGDGSVWWHTLIFHFHFCSTCCLGVRQTKRYPRKSEKKVCRLTLSIILVLCFLILFFCLSPASRQRRWSFFFFFCQIDCELAALLLEMLCFPTLTPVHWLKPSQVSISRCQGESTTALTHSSA